MNSTLPTKGNFYRFDDITVDCENFRVRKNGQDITLTPRAFDVLIFLLHNGGRVVEKKEIFDFVWKDTFVGDNALTKIIKEIRRALNDDANKPRYIETVPKRGYRFIANVKNGAETELTESSKEASLGEESQEEIPQPPTKKFLTTKRKYLLITGAVVLVLLVSTLSFVIFTERRSEIAAQNAPLDSIAVLPFENTTQDVNLDYLSDGITENIINTLSRFPGLRVLPRSTVFNYKNKQEDPHTIGRMLRVRVVLTGKVVRRGDLLTIQTELIDVDRKAQIWGQQYNRPLTDVINLQEEISRTIVDRLRLRLTGTEQQQLAQRETDNDEAYQFYLKGNYFAGKRTGEDLARAVEFYRQAIALDPNYAVAFAGLSEAYNLMPAKIPVAEAKLRAREAALKAIQLNPNSAEVNTAWGYIIYRQDWNWAEAERVFGRAIELNPNYATAHLRYGEMLSLQSRNAEAIKELRRAVELEPLSIVINRLYGAALLTAGQTDEALAQLQKTVELDPNSSTAHSVLGKAYEAKEMYAEAVAEFAKGLELSENLEAAQAIRDGFAKDGWQGQLHESLKYLQKHYKTHSVSDFNVAALHARLGEKEEAFNWLEKSYQARETAIIGLKVMPEFQKWRDDTRYTDLLRRIGLQP